MSSGSEERSLSASSSPSQQHTKRRRRPVALGDTVSNGANASSTLTPTARSSRSHVTQRSTVKKKKQTTSHFGHTNNNHGQLSKNNNNNKDNVEFIDSDSDESIGKGLCLEKVDALAVVRANNAKRRESSLLLSQRLDSSSEDEGLSPALVFGDRRRSPGSSANHPRTNVTSGEKPPPVASLPATNHSESVTSHRTQDNPSSSLRRNKSNNSRSQSWPRWKTTGLSHSSSDSSSDIDSDSGHRRSNGLARSRAGAGRKTTGLSSSPSNTNNNSTNIDTHHRNNHTAPREAAAAESTEDTPPQPPPGTQEAPIEFSDEEVSRKRVRYSIERPTGMDKEVVVLEDSDDSDSECMVVATPLRSPVTQPCHSPTAAAEGRALELELGEKDETILTGNDSTSRLQHDNDSSSRSLSSVNSNLQPNISSDRPQSNGKADCENPLNSAMAISQTSSRANVTDSSEGATHSEDSAGVGMMPAQDVNCNNNKNTSDMTSTEMSAPAIPVTQDTSVSSSASHQESEDPTCTEHVAEDAVPDPPPIVQRFESLPSESRRLKQEDVPEPSTVTGQTKKVRKPREKKYNKKSKDLGNYIQVERLNTSYMARLVLKNEQEVVVVGKDGAKRVRVQWEDRRTREDVLLEEINRDTEIEVPRTREPDDAVASVPLPPPPTGRPRRAARRRVKTDFYTCNVKQEDTEDNVPTNTVKEEEDSVDIETDADNSADSADWNPKGRKKQSKKAVKRKPKNTRAPVKKRRGIKTDPDKDEVPVHLDVAAIKADPDEEMLDNETADADVAVDQPTSTLQPASPPRRNYPPVRHRPRPPSETGRQPRIWNNKTKIKVPPRQTEIGDVVYFVETRDSYSYSHGMTSEELFQQPSARVVGDSYFGRTTFFYNQPERLLQLQCDETSKRWYVLESSVQNPHFVS